MSASAIRGEGLVKRFKTGRTHIEAMSVAAKA